MPIINRITRSPAACALMSLAALAGLHAPSTIARPAPPGISVSDAVVTEGAAEEVEFIVSIDAQPSRRRPVAVSVSTAPDSATDSGDSRDFEPAEETLTFERGEPLSKSFRVRIRNDEEVEGAERFFVYLDSAENARIVDAEATGTILDDDEQANQAPACVIETPAGATTVAAGTAVNFSATVSDPDGGAVTVAWEFPGGDPAGSAEEDPGAVNFAVPGRYTVTLNATDQAGAPCFEQARRVTVTDEPLPATSINSTSVSGLPLGMSPVAERPQVLGTAYKVFAINDLGMHCVDIDGRIANILPPFQVMPVQVVLRGAEPELNPEGIELFYSAASNPADPILTAAGTPSSIAPDGTVFKSNFWDMIQRGAWASFYPPVLPVPLADLVAGDQGLLVPNTEALYIGPDQVVDGVEGSSDGELLVSQQTMPGIGGPGLDNAPQPVHEHYTHKPFFINFPFGYVAEEVNLHEGAGIPFSPFDDFGRQNPFPLVRVEARSGEVVVATVDTVLPVSGETACSNCHGALEDVTERLSRAPIDALTAAGLPVARSAEDPAVGTVPHAVSVEYAADINILRLHDLKHGAAYVDTANDPAICAIAAAPPNGGDNCLAEQALRTVDPEPVVCQNCHYTPALDLAQLGPLAGPPGSAANGRNQLAHESNSRVMHNHHGSLAGLFPPIPQADQDPVTGDISNQAERMAALEQNCYQCHPGKETNCLRGAMFNGGILCSDCHGTMAQVGADFTAGVSPDNPGDFLLGLGNFYEPGSAQPRVPWANEPGCGSCHTGDANDNLAGEAGVLVNLKDSNGVSDGIRLRQAFRTGDAKATPIVPANKLFAEPAVPEAFNGFENPGAGNPKLYRVSSGHGGVMCEGCHGATHAEWPVADPAANDNLLALQVQGHTGPIIECTACHDTGALPDDTLGGPHNLHLIDDRRFWKEGHKDLAKRENGRPGGGMCGDCHGSDHRGTVLSRAAADRSFLVEDSQRRVSAGEPVACDLCHSLEKSFGR